MRISRKFLLFAAAVPALLIPTAAVGYIRLNTGDPAALFDLSRADSTAIQFYINALVAPGATSSASGALVQVLTADSDPTFAMNAALSAWVNVTTAGTKFLPLQSTTAGIDPNDFKNVVAIADSASLSIVGGALAVTNSSFTTGTGTLGPYTVTPGNIVDSDIIINPKYAFSTNGTAVDLQSVLTHELGHSLGANHTAVLGATMFHQTSTGQSNQRNLSSDDLAFVNAAYPKATGGAATGKLSGAISLAGGGVVGYPLITAIDVTSGAMIGGLGAADGTFSIQVPPGTYYVDAEPFNLVQPGNLYFTAAQAAAVTKFQAAMLGGAASPTPVFVTAGGTGTANIAVAAGTTTLAMQSAAFGAAGGSGDVLNLNGIGGPVLVASGKKLDMVFHGPGLVSSLTDANFKVFGQGISVVPGSVRADTKVTTSDGLPYMRVTLDIAARQAQGLASIFITSGSNSLALSGLLVLGAQTPAFTPGGVVNAATYTYIGVVAPGEIIAVFGPKVGPANPVNANFNSSGVYSKDAGDTRVLFDGVPASEIFVAGTQTDLVVPYSVAGKQSTQMVIEYQGIASPAVTVPVQPTAPGMFPGVTLGQAAALNSDNKTLNTAATPEKIGTGVIVLYLTGEGQTSPAGVDGQAAITSFPKPLATVSVTIGGQPAEIQYAGAAPFYIAGLMQVNAKIPAGIPAGAVPVVVKIGGVASPPANIYVQ